MDAVAAHLTSTTGRPYYVYTGSFREDISGDSNRAGSTMVYDVFLIREGTEGMLESQNSSEPFKFRRMALLKFLSYPRGNEGVVAHAINRSNDIDVELGSTNFSKNSYAAASSSDVGLGSVVELEKASL